MYATRVSTAVLPLQMAQLERPSWMLGLTDIVVREYLVVLEPDDGGFGFGRCLALEAYRATDRTLNIVLPHLVGL